MQRIIIRASVRSSFLSLMFLHPDKLRGFSPRKTEISRALLKTISIRNFTYLNYFLAAPWKSHSSHHDS